MDKFLVRFASSEAALPASWKKSPLPTAPTKHPVGRPKKRPLGGETDAPVTPSKRSRDDCNVPVSNCSLESDCASVIPSKRGAYRNLSAKQKREVVKFAKERGVRCAARQFKISKSSVSDWVKTNFDLGQRNKSGHLPKAGRPLTYSEDIDAKLCAFVLEQRDLQLPVSVDDICNLAIELIQPANPDFKASRTWANKFMRRHDLVLRAKTSKAFSLPADLKRKLDDNDDEFEGFGPEDLAKSMDNVVCD